MLSVLFIGLIALVLGALLGAAAARLKEQPQALENKIYELLPHTQCAQCGYPGCRPFAQALAQGKAAITQCPPGGEALVTKLAELTGELPGYRPAAGQARSAPARAALIDEASCVGCALCLPACPVDAIVGAPRQMHTVITALCTGCELCLPPCPVDCIAMIPLQERAPAWLPADRNGGVHAVAKAA